MTSQLSSSFNLQPTRGSRGRPFISGGSTTESSTSRCARRFRVQPAEQLTFSTFAVGSPSAFRTLALRRELRSSPLRTLSHSAVSPPLPLSFPVGPPPPLSFSPSLPLALSSAEVQQPPQERRQGLEGLRPQGRWSAARQVSAARGSYGAARERGQGLARVRGPVGDRQAPRQGSAGGSFQWRLVLPAWEVGQPEALKRGRLRESGTARDRIETRGSLLAFPIATVANCNQHLRAVIHCPQSRSCSTCERPHLGEVLLVEPRPAPPHPLENRPTERCVLAPMNLVRDGLERRGKRVSMATRKGLKKERTLRLSLIAASIARRWLRTVDFGRARVRPGRPGFAARNGDALLKTAGERERAPRVTWARLAHSRKTHLGEQRGAKSAASHLECRTGPSPPIADKGDPPGAGRPARR